MENTTREAQQVPGTPVARSPGSDGGGSHRGRARLADSDSLGPSQLSVLRLEQIELLGEEHSHHEEQEQDEGG